MTKSELFKAAHALTRKVIQAGDDYRITFGAALKSLATPTVSLLDRLIAVGGSLWERGDMRRVYFNDLDRLMGLSISCYKTGNISGARLNGEKISNSQARRMLSRVEKVWFDLGSERFFYRATDSSLAESVVKNIRTLIA